MNRAHDDGVVSTSASGERDVAPAAAARRPARRNAEDGDLGSGVTFKDIQRRADCARTMDLAATALMQRAALLVEMGDDRLAVEVKTWQAAVLEYRHAGGLRCDPGSLTDASLRAIHCTPP